MQRQAKQDEVKRRSALYVENYAMKQKGGEKLLSVKALDVIRSN